MTDLTSVIDAACAAAPGLDRRVIAQLIDEAAPLTQQRNKLVEHLAETAAFTSGASDVPPVVARMLVALADAGAPVKPPACDECERVVPLVYKRGNGRVCKACGVKGYIDTCCTCRQVRRVNSRTADGSAYCKECWNRLHPQTCAGCGRQAVISRRLPNGDGLCQTCYERPEHECSVCGQTAPIQSRKSGKPVCRSCYRSPAGLCGRCGETRQLAARNVAGVGNLCTRCWKPATHTCVVCQERKPCHVSKNDGKPRCAACAPRPLVMCVRCGRDRPVQARIDIGSVCNSCYDHVVGGRCTDCDQTTRIYADGRCHRCALTKELDAAFGLRPELQPVHIALVEGRSPASTLRWFAHRPGGALLRQIAAGEIELSHDALDAYGRDLRHVDHVRQLLVATGVLPDRGELAERLAVWLDGFAGSLPPAHARVVKPFGEWRVLRRVRRQDERGRLTDGSAKWARQRVRAAASLLEWLDMRDLELASLGQIDLDAWLAAGPTTRYCIRDFLRWAHERDEAPKLSVPLRQDLTAAERADDAERWALVEDLLHNDDVPLDLRVAGLLVLIYGQHLSRVVAIRLDAIESGPPATISLGASPVEMLEPLGELVRQLAASPRGHSGASVDNPWLFPGGHAGEHVTPEHLRRRLDAATGIRMRPTRNTALLHLARELPVPVLADLLGLHFNTAVEWVRLARGDWAAYVASRDATARLGPTTTGRGPTSPSGRRP